MTYNRSSRLEQKRSQPWFLDSSDTDLFPNKKQTVEVPNHASFSGLLTSNTFHWENASSFQPVTGHFNERLFVLETERGVSFDHGNDSSVGIVTMNLESKVHEDSFESRSSFDPRSGLEYSGLRKVKVNQVNNSEDYMSAASEHVCASSSGDIMQLSCAYSKACDASMTLGLSCNKKDKNVISMTNTFMRVDDNLISMDQFHNEDDCHILIGQSYKIDNDSILSSYCLKKDGTNVMAMMDKNAILMSNTFKDSDDVVPVGQSFSKDDNNVTSISQIFNKEIDDTLSIVQTDNNADASSFLLGHTCNKMSNGGLPVGLSFINGESTVLSFGGLNNYEEGNPLERPAFNHDLGIGQSSYQNSEALNQKRLIDSNAELLVSDAQMFSGGSSFPNKKVEQKAKKKAPLNYFPSNVKSLLSTGIFDGVPVKYVALSREVISCCHEFVI